MTRTAAHLQRSPGHPLLTRFPHCNHAEHRIDDELASREVARDGEA